LNWSRFQDGLDSATLPPAFLRESPKSNDPQFEHPRGTVAIVLIFGALFSLGWFAMYAWRFMATGAPHH
jgi:hypothetical protein